MVSVSVSSLQVAVNIHYNNCIVRILKMCHKEVCFFSVPMRVKMKCVGQVESMSPYSTMPQSNNAYGRVKHKWTECTINDYNKSQNFKKYVRMHQCIDDALIRRL